MATCEADSDAPLQSTSCSCPSSRTTNYVVSYFGSILAAVFATLDELTRELQYVPVMTATWRATARLWAEQRRAGRPTGAGLDGDLLLAIQAREELAAVVTLNEKHFAGLIDVFSWTSVPMSAPVRR